MSDNNSYNYTNITSEDLKKFDAAKKINNTPEYFAVWIGFSALMFLLLSDLLALCFTVIGFFIVLFTIVGEDNVNQREDAVIDLKPTVEQPPIELQPKHRDYIRKYIYQPTEEEIIDAMISQNLRRPKGEENRYCLEEAEDILLRQLVADPAVREKMYDFLGRQEILDASTHENPVVYHIYGSHPKQTLALRYGIELDEDQSTVKIRKIKEVEENLFLAELHDYSKDRNKTLKVIVAHHVGEDEDFIRSFLPINRKTETVDNDWFIRNRKLEDVLKDNKHMSLGKIVHYYLTLAKVK